MLLDLRPLLDAPFRVADYGEEYQRLRQSPRYLRGEEAMMGAWATGMLTDEEYLIWLATVRRL